MSEFLDMGGYAAFVWSSYAVATIVLCGLLVLSLKSMREREALVETLRKQRSRSAVGNPVAREQTS